MRNKNLGPKIIELRSLGFTYPQISEKLKCSKGSVAYHCGSGQKEKCKNRSKKFRKSEFNTLNNKMYTFLEKRSVGFIRESVFKNINNNLTRKMTSFSKNRKTNISKNMFTLEELKQKIGENPVCYLTGRSIDLSKPKEYSLDHIIPIAKGGDNSLQNCGLACRDANQAKTDMNLEDFYKLCEDVVENKKASVA